MSSRSIAWNLYITACLKAVSFSSASLLSASIWHNFSCWSSSLSVRQVWISWTSNYKGTCSCWACWSSLHLEHPKNSLLFKQSFSKQTVSMLSLCITPFHLRWQIMLGKAFFLTLCFETPPFPLIRTYFPPTSFARVSALFAILKF